MGVELAAELRQAAGQLVEYGLDSIAPDDMRITLVDAGPRILPALAPEISESVKVAFAKMGVTVLTSTMISAATAEGLTTRAGYRIPASLKVWAAGICAPQFLSGLDGLETNRLNQLRVLATLQTTSDWCRLARRQRTCVQGTSVIGTAAFSAARTTLIGRGSVKKREPAVCRATGEAAPSQLPAFYDRTDCATPARIGRCEITRLRASSLAVSLQIRGSS
jgi:hypothetical protein